LAKSHATSTDPWATRWLKDHDAGFGPFKLEELSPDHQVVWVAHEEHPFPPKLDQITWRQVPESSVRLAMLTTGEVQAARYLSPTDIARISDSRDTRLWNFQGNSIASIPMNLRFPPLNDVRVRRALSYATPYQQIEDVYRGLAGSAYGPLSDRVAGFDPYLRPYTYDPERARQLLRESGHADGFATALVYSSADADGPLVSAVLHSAFKDVGVTLGIKGLSPEAYTRAIVNDEQPMYFQTMGAESPDPAFALGTFYDSESVNNWSGYRSVDTDECLAAARRPQLSWEQRVAAHKRCAELIANDAPWLWLAQLGFQIGTRRNVTGINWYAGEAVDWSQVSFTS